MIDHVSNDEEEKEEKFDKSIISDDKDKLKLPQSEDITKESHNDKTEPYAGKVKMEPELDPLVQVTGKIKIEPQMMDLLDQFENGLVEDFNQDELSTSWHYSLMIYILLLSASCDIGSISSSLALQLLPLLFWIVVFLSWSIVTGHGMARAQGESIKKEKIKLREARREARKARNEKIDKAKDKRKNDKGATAENENKTAIKVINNIAAIGGDGKVAIQEAKNRAADNAIDLAATVFSKYGGMTFFVWGLTAWPDKFKQSKGTSAEHVDDFCQECFSCWIHGRITDDEVNTLTAEEERKRKNEEAAAVPNDDSDDVPHPDADFHRYYSLASLWLPYYVPSGSRILPVFEKEDKVSVIKTKGFCRCCCRQTKKVQPSASAILGNDVGTAGTNIVVSNLLSVDKTDPNTQVTASIPPEVNKNTTKVMDAGSSAVAIIPTAKISRGGSTVGFSDKEREKVSGQSFYFPLVLTGSAPSWLLCLAPITFAFQLVFTSLAQPPPTPGKPVSYVPFNGIGYLYPYLTATMFIMGFVALNFGLCATWLPTVEVQMELDKRIKEWEAKKPEAKNIRREALRIANKSAARWSRKHIEGWFIFGTPANDPFWILQYVSCSTTLAGSEVLQGTCIYLLPILLYTGKYLVNPETWDLDGWTKFNFWSGWIACVLTTTLACMSYGDLFLKNVKLAVVNCVNRHKAMTSILKDKKILRQLIGKDVSFFESVEIWLKARYFLEIYDCNFVFASLSPFFGLSMLTGIAGITFIIIIIFTNNLADWIDVATYVALCTCFSIILAWGMGTQIVQSNDALNDQINLLKRYRRWASSRSMKSFVKEIPRESSAESTDGTSLNNSDSKWLEEESGDAAAKFFDDIIDDLNTNNSPPRVLGIQIRPTVFQVFQGYIATGVIAIVAHFIQVLINSNPIPNLGSSNSTAVDLNFNVASLGGSG